MAHLDLGQSFTRKYHLNTYPAIAATRSSLSAVGKIIVITGGSRGLGLAIANAFCIAQASYIVLVARNQQRLQNAKDALTKISDERTQISYYVSDIADMEMITVFDSIRHDIGEPDILVLNAAYCHTPERALDVGSLQVEQSFNVNVYANLRLTSYFLDSPLELSSQKIVINVSNIAAHTRQSYMSANGASRQAWISLLDHIQHESFGKLRVHHLNPGMIMSQELTNQGFKENEWEWVDRKSNHLKYCSAKEVDTNTTDSSASCLHCGLARLR